MHVENILIFIKFVVLSIIIIRYWRYLVIITGEERKETIRNVQNECKRIKFASEYVTKFPRILGKFGEIFHIHGFVDNVRWMMNCIKSIYNGKLILRQMQSITLQERDTGFVPVHLECYTVNVYMSGGGGIFCIFIYLQSKVYLNHEGL